MNIGLLNLQTLLGGSRAFYEQEDYDRAAFKELEASKAISRPLYKYSTESSALLAAKKIISVVIFPIGLYQWVHSLLGQYAFVPAAKFPLDDLSKRRTEALVDANSDLQDSTLLQNWKFKRISIEVDGDKIDAMMIGTPSTLQNGRWVLASNGNGEFYEDKLSNTEFKETLDNLKSNALVFNYPGVGCSEGVPSRGAMIKSYKAMLAFLEDQQKGLGAKEIIGVGHSLGAAIQGEAIKDHSFKEDTKYCFVKSRTFSYLSDVVSQITGSRMLAWSVCLFGWDVSPVASSEALESPEIIIQTADVKKYTDIAQSPEKIIHDGIIAPEVSLAHKMLKNYQAPNQTKSFIGIPEPHNHGFKNIPRLTSCIDQMLENQSVNLSR